MSCLRKFFSIFAFSISTVSLGQFPSYSSPLEIAVVPSGNFGELRPGHFHAGIDLKTLNREGLNVHSVEEGYISRIKISTSGYGKALYVTHPDGLTSVYGHLKKFSKKIDAYIKKIQYAKQVFTLDVTVPKEDLQIKKGEIIAFSGNTGSSFAPHLHFELRDTQTETPKNPQSFGINFEDNIAPSIKEIYCYPLGENAMVNGSKERIKVNFRTTKKGELLADKIKAIDSIGLGILVYDKQDSSNNELSIYKLEVFVNGVIHLSYRFDEIPFDKAIFINTLIDYDHYQKEKEYIQKCFVTEENTLDIYTSKINNGILEIKEDMTYHVDIVISDFYGNTSSVRIPIEGTPLTKTTPQEEVKEKEETQTILHNRDHFFNLKESTLYFPTHCFFRDVKLFIKEDEKNKIITIKSDKPIPLRKSYSLSFDISQYEEKDVSQLFIIDCKTKAPIYSYKKENLLIGSARALGEFTLARDSISPSIKIRNFKPNEWIVRNQALEFRISDLGSGIQSYKVSVNDQWILAEYEPKRNLLFFDLEDLSFDKVEKNISVTVTDGVGNISTLETMIYKQ